MRLPLFIAWRYLFAHKKLGAINIVTRVSVLAIAVVALVYFLEIWIDNNFARVKWQAMLSSAWAVAFVAGFVNIAVLAYL